MSRENRIVPGSPRWHLIIQLYKNGKSLKFIAHHPDISKDHTTVLYHLQKAGLSFNNRYGSAKIVPAKKMYKDRKEVFGSDRCSGCGMKKDMMPANHNCAPGNYHEGDKHDRYGHSFSD